jgi:hypothetical protein
MTYYFFENALDNLIKCIESDSKIAMIVPTTPTVANLQKQIISQIQLDLRKEQDFVIHLLYICCQVKPNNALSSNDKNNK